MVDPHTVEWLRCIVSEASRAKDDRGIALIESCGRLCCRLGGHEELAKQVRAAATDKDDVAALVAAFCKKFSQKYRAELVGDEILIDYGIRECVCPVVRAAKIEDPFFCNCTGGFAKAIYEALLGRPVEVEIRKSLLRGDDRCVLAVRVAAGTPERTCLC
jgi:hypothetical protein